MADNMESLVGVTAESMAGDLESHRQQMKLSDTAEGLARKPLLVLSADDGLASRTDALVAEIRAHGGRLVQTEHVATDHSWSDSRIKLESRVVAWLESQPGRR
jgi:hypothetical protein